MHSQDLGRVAIVPRGQYDPEAVYERLDAVGYNGSSYMVLKHCQGVTPADGEYYMLMAQAGDSTAAEEAANKANQAAERANASANAAQEVVDTVMPDINQLKDNVDNKQDKLIPGQGITIGDDGRSISADGAGGSDFYKLIVPGKTYQTIPGKAFDGFGNLKDFEDALLVLVEVPADCAFLIVTKFNYKVAYGSNERYSTPQYLDADYNRISSCKVNNNANNVENTYDFCIITLCDVPDGAQHIAIPYVNGTDYSIEFACLNYAENISGCLIDGHLPYGINLFEDGRNIVQNIFHNVGYTESTATFNVKTGSKCTAPVLYNGGSRIYHDGVANAMYYFAFDNANGFISSGIINSGRDLPEIENAVCLIFQSFYDFTWISYSDLSLAGYKQPKKIRDDLLDLHIARKKLEYPYNGMVASFIGDSLTANGSGGDYISYINSFFAFSKITNCGIGGTRISGESSSFGDPMWMDSRINDLDIDSDIIFVMGGTNDAPSGDRYLGDITPENYDTSTFVGAYNVLLSKIFYRYGLVDGLYDGIDYSGVVQAENARDIRLFLITPPQRFPNRDSAENPWHYAANTNLYADAVLKIGEMHGIPVADIRSCAGINIFNRDRYICGPDVSNRNGSGVHLSKDAHKRWAEVIIGKMLEIVSDYE